MPNIYYDKHKSFSVPLVLSKKKELPKDVEISYIKSKKAIIDKENDKQYYEARTKKHKVVYYQLYKKRPSFYKVKGYVRQPDLSAIALCSFNMFFIIFIMVGLLLIGGVLFGGKIASNIDLQTNNSNVTKEEPTIPQGSGVTNLDDLLHSNGEQTDFSVPQFSGLYITNGIYIPLMNLPQNQVYMMYEVYNTKNELVFASKEPIPPNDEDRWYLEGYEKGSYEFIVRAYKVNVDEGKVIKGNSVTFNTTIYIY